MNDVGTVSDLRDRVGPALEVAANKEMPRLDAHCRHFMSLAPILFISTTGADGRADVSPRGDPPGFVKILDDRTILLPDRPGNRRVDTMSNILGNPGSSVGLIFLVPGVDEVLRASGRASVSSDQALLQIMAVDGKVPKLAVKIVLDEVFFHCGKALKRARIWDPSMKIDRKSFPSMGQLIHDQRKPDRPVEALDAFVENNYRTELY